MSAKKQHYESDHLDVRYDPPSDTVEMHWKSFVSGEPFREGLNRGLEVVEDTGASNWFADLRDLGTVDQDDQAWSNEDWFPRAIAAGLESMAIVKPESVVAEMSVDNIMQEVEGADLTTYTVDDPEEARDWLDDQ